MKLKSKSPQRPSKTLRTWPENGRLVSAGLKSWIICCFAWSVPTKPQTSKSTWTNL